MMRWKHVCAADALQETHRSTEEDCWVQKRNLKAAYNSVAIGRKSEFCVVYPREGDLQPLNSSSVVLGWQGSRPVLGCK